mgnify:CR=1 FL=1
MRSTQAAPTLRVRGRAFAQISEFHPELTAFRRDLHAHPELGFEEVYTAARVVEALKVCGVDEVHTGIGRTGTWFACEQWPVAPDLITTAKSLAGGFPLAGVVGRAEVMDAPAPGGLGGTYAGSPVACAAALAVMEAFDKEELLARSRAMGALLVTWLSDLAKKVPAIGDVRGLGAMVAIELCEAGDVHRPDAALAKKVVAEAARRGLILLSCGTYGNVIRILVPLTASDELLEEGLGILADSLAAVA